jgi:hypothetical protein
LGFEQRKEVEQVLLHSIGEINFYIYLGKEEFGGIFILALRELLQGEILKC